MITSQSKATPNVENDDFLSGCCPAFLNKYDYDQFSFDGILSKSLNIEITLPEILFIPEIAFGFFIVQEVRLCIYIPYSIETLFV